MDLTRGDERVSPILGLNIFALLVLEETKRHKVLNEESCRGRRAKLALNPILLNFQSLDPGQDSNPPETCLKKPELRKA